MARRSARGAGGRSARQTSRAGDAARATAERGGRHLTNRAEDAAVDAVAPAGTDPETPWWRRAWSRGVAAIVTAGALAGAVTAVLALWPDPDPADSARFTAVSVFSPVSLGDYQQRSVQVVPLGAGLGSVGTPDVVLAGATSTAEPEPTAPTTSAGSPTPTSPSGSPSPSGSTTPTGSGSPSGSASASPVDLPGLRDHVADVLGLVRERASDYLLPGAGLGTAPASPVPTSTLPTPSAPPPQQLPSTVFAIVAAAATDETGEPVPKDVAAERLVELLGETRTTEAQGKQEPLGAVVDVNVELEGLRGQPVQLSWSIFPQSGGEPLFGTWLQTIVAYRLEATSDRDSASFDLWLPLPRDPGPYVARLLLTADDTGIASTSTQPFG